MTLTNKEYIRELKELEDRMFRAEKFATKFPYFKNQIIDEKIVGDGFVKFRSSYKDMPLHWGVCRSYFKTSEKLTNYGNTHEELNMHLSIIYINTLCLYDRHENFGLFGAIKDSAIFYVDHANTTFYVKDEDLKSFLDQLNDWYLLAKEQAKRLSHRRKIQKLQSELAILEK